MSVSVINRVCVCVMSVYVRVFVRACAYVHVCVSACVCV